MSRLSLILGSELRPWKSRLSGWRRLATLQHASLHSLCDALLSATNTSHKLAGEIPSLEDKGERTILAGLAVADLL